MRLVIQRKIVEALKYIFWVRFSLIDPARTLHFDPIRYFQCLNMKRAYGSTNSDGAKRHRFTSGSYGTLHPENPYRDKPPSFSLLGQTYPALRAHLRRNGSRNSIDFTDIDASCVLTETLLHHDFNITMTLPRDCLCPPLPNRLNYLCWM